MCGRVVPVDTAAEYGNGVTVSLERAAMSLTVDSPRKAADDDEPGGRELASEHARDLRTVRRAGPRADDRNGRLRQQLRSSDAAEVQTRRRIVNRPQERRQRSLGEEAHWAASAR